jgi:bloom syndrome protein
MNEDEELKAHENSPQIESYLEPSPVFSQTTPLRSGRKHITPPFDTVESIDLTGEIGPLTSASSITNSGDQPSSLTEDTATRKDFYKELRTKWKNEEYTSGVTEDQSTWKANSSPNLEESSTELLAESDRASHVTPSNFAQWHRQDCPNLPQNREKEDEDDWFDVNHVESMFGSAEPEFDPQPSSMYGLENQKEGQHHFSLSRSTCSDTVGQSARNAVKITLKEAKSSSQENDQNLSNFMAILPEFFAQLKSRLKETLQTNAELAYELLLRGQSAMDLIATNKDLVAQMDAIELLQKSREAYRKIIAQRESLKQSLMREISQGFDPTTMPEELDKCRAIEAKMREIDSTIRGLLPQAKIFEMVQCSASDRSESPA